MHTAKYGWFTAMLVPDSERGVLQFRFPILALQVFVGLFVALVFVLIAFFSSYMALLEDRMELQQVRQVNRWQRDRLVYLEDQHQVLQSSLSQVTELDAQIREMLDLKPGDDTASFLAASIAAEYRMDSAADQQPAAIASGQTLSDPALGDLARLEVEAESMARSIVSHKESLLEMRSVIAAEQAALAATPTIWPVGNGIITSGYGYRRSPLGGGYEFHRGVDMAAPRGTPVLSAAEGVVTFSGWLNIYGLVLRIDHGNGYETKYAHLDKMLVEVGDRVIKGQMIGLVGSTGRSTGPHLHYEVSIDGTEVNPLGYLQTRAP